VTAVHDLHVWSMSTTETALTAHLVRPHVENEDWLLARAAEEMADRFGIRHVTIQIERDAERASCNQAEAGTL
jgi:cobalt-zinc-cadmium efflux system protein